MGIADIHGGNNEWQDVPLGTPPIRRSDLNHDSNVYDRLVAAPSDHDLVFMWGFHGILLFFLTIFIALVMSGVLTSHKAFKNPFNIYLVFLMIPDFIFCLLCGIACALNALNGSWLAPWLCRFETVYIVWAVSSNAWLNAVVAYQLHRLLTSSNVRRKFEPPTHRQVVKHALIVYAWCLFVACWGLVERDWFPHRTGAMIGEGCIPLRYDRKSSFFFFLVYMPCFAVIPLVYVFYVMFDIYRRKLLPPAGKRRLLVIYFSRILAVFVIMWLPYLLLVFVAGIWPWAIYVGSTWGHFQGAVSAVMSLMKPDVRKGTYRLVYYLICCGRTPPRVFNPNGSGNASSMNTSAVTSGYSNAFSSQNISQSGVENTSRAFQEGDGDDSSRPVNDPSSGSAGFGNVLGDGPYDDDYDSDSDDDNDGDEGGYLSKQPSHNSRFNNDNTINSSQPIALSNELQSSKQSLSAIEPIPEVDIEQDDSLQFSITENSTKNTEHQQPQSSSSIGLPGETLPTTTTTTTINKPEEPIVSPASAARERKRYIEHRLQSLRKSSTSATSSAVTESSNDSDANNSSGRNNDNGLV